MKVLYGIWAKIGNSGIWIVNPQFLTVEDALASKEFKKLLLKARVFKCFRLTYVIKT